MIIDFRYHIASLVAVFLALGVGILIGGAILGNTALQKELVQIEENLAKLRNDQRAMDVELAKREADLRVQNQFDAAILPTLVRNKLLGKRVALVRTNPNTDARLLKDLARLFQLAGSKVSSTTTILRNPAELEPDKLTALGNRLGLTEQETGTIPGEVLRLAIDRIVNGPMFDEPAAKAVLPSLTAAKVLETSGDYGGMVDILVLLGGSQVPDFDTSRDVDRILIEAVAGAKGLSVAAVEPSNVAVSYLPEYLEHPIIVVDNIDTVPGQTALVLALVRGRKGHFGIKGTHQLLPEVFWDRGDRATR